MLTTIKRRLGANITEERSTVMWYEQATGYYFKPRKTISRDIAVDVHRLGYKCSWEVINPIV